MPLTYTSKPPYSCGILMQLSETVQFVYEIGLWKHHVQPRAILNAFIMWPHTCHIPMFDFREMKTGWNLKFRKCNIPTWNICCFNKDLKGLTSHIVLLILYSILRYRTWELHLNLTNFYFLEPKKNQRINTMSCLGRGKSQRTCALLEPTELNPSRLDIKLTFILDSLWH